MLAHVFTQSPAGGALHAFAVEEGQAVGHCAVIPHPAKRGDAGLRCGKLEALWIQESHRARRAGEAPLYRTLLDTLYAFADDHGLELIHGHATPRIGRVIRFTPLEPVGKPSWVGAIRPDGVAATALAAVQRGLRALVRPGSPAVRPPTADDVDLLDAPAPPAGSWAPVLGEAWDWYRSSPLVRVVEVPGEHGCRALIQVPATPLEPVRLVGWRPRRRGVRPAAALLSSAARIARDAGAPTLRFQPWPSEAGNGDLERACRLLGLVRRADRTTLWVRTSDPSLARAEAVVPSPLFYLAF